MTLQDPPPISHRLRLKQNPSITFLVAFPAFVPIRQSRNESAKAKIRKMSWCISHRAPEPSVHLLQFTHSSVISSAPNSTPRMGGSTCEAHMPGEDPRPGGRPCRGSGLTFQSQQIRFQPQLYVQMTQPFHSLIRPYSCSEGSMR